VIGQSAAANPQLIYS